MEKQILDKYIKAGKIAAEVREESKKLVKPGFKLLELAEKIEQLVKQKGGEMAFPVNISVNETAAHYTPTINDETVFKENDVVKIDIGSHVDGYIADTAATISLDPERKDMVQTINKALENAIKIIKPGVNIGKIGEVIEKTITEKGYKPVSNLTGHSLSQYNLHSGIIIPNIKADTNETLKQGDVIAIEPFLTDGGGKIKESEKAMIYMYSADRPVRLQSARQILNMSKFNFNRLPFATRWIKNIPPNLAEMSLRQLTIAGALQRYPILREVNNGIVTQAEHTVIVLDKPIVTTR